MKKFPVLNFCNDTLLQNLTPKSDDLLSEKLWSSCSSEKLSMKKRLAGNFHNLWVSTFHVQKMTLNDHTKAAMCYGPRQVRRKVLFWNSIFLRHAVCQPVEQPMSLWWERNCGKSINSFNDHLHRPPLDNCYCTNLMAISYSHIRSV